MKALLSNRLGGNLAAQAVQPAKQVWVPVERAVLEGLQPLVDLKCALASGDQEAIWAQYKASREPGVYLDWLAGVVSSLAFPARHQRDVARMSTWNAELTLGSVVTHRTNGATIGEAVQGAGIMCPAVQEWFCGQHASVCAELIPYRELCMWEPLRQVEMLQALMAQPQRWQTKPYADVQCFLDNALPHLYFLACGAATWLAEPTLPGLGARADYRVRQSLRSGTEFLMGARATCATPPMPVTQAVQLGLSNWLSEIADVGLITSWSAQPRVPDVVVVRLFGGDGDLLGEVPIRLHQLEPGGIELLMEQLSREVGPPVC